jgi:hypothetical protein
MLLGLIKASLDTVPQDQYLQRIPEHPSLAFPLVQHTEYTCDTKLIDDSKTT